jgi:hypothetical protein
MIIVHRPRQHARVVGLPLFVDLWRLPGRQAACAGIQPGLRSVSSYLLNHSPYLAAGISEGLAEKRVLRP